jgi:RHS repeat-associated protein
MNTTSRLTSLTDYYPFGSAMEGRTVTEGYRYGFNAMEREDELYAPGSAYDFGARMYDGRLGRWWSVDPLAGKYPSMSAYCFALNSPNLFKDPNGKEAVITIQRNENGGGKIVISSIVYVTGAEAM